jgi:hypothetical protein
MRLTVIEWAKRAARKAANFDLGVWFEMSDALSGPAALGATSEEEQRVREVAHYCDLFG